MKLPSLHLTGIQSHFSYGKRIMPTRDWLVLLASALILLIVSAVWNTLTFYKTSKGEPLTLSNVPVEKVDTAQSIDVTDIIERRAKQREVYEAGPLFVDPGI